ITGIPAASILAGTFGTGAYVFDNTVSGITILTGGTASTTSALNTQGALHVGGVSTFDGLLSGAGFDTTWDNTANASSTIGNKAYNDLEGSPSDRITDGTNLTWAGDTLNVDDAFLLLAGDSSSGDYVLTGTWDFSNAWVSATSSLDYWANTSSTMATAADIVTAIAAHLAVVADTNTTGHLNDTDWDTFNNKQAALGFTPVNSADWTTNNSYPAACAAGSYTQGLGDTLSCTDASTEIDSIVATHASDDDAHQPLVTITGEDYAGLSTQLITFSKIDAANTDLTDNYFWTGTNTSTNLFIGTLFKLPFGAAPTIDDTGEFALDTTDEQMIIADSSGTARVIQTKTRIWGATLASTTPEFISGGLYPIPVDLDGYTMTEIRCKVDGGTNKVIAIEDASANSSEDITCLATVTSDDGSITNAGVTAAEEMYIDFGATSGAVNYVSISVFGLWTRE
ncbi:hypothetical protein KAR91_38780, partial [Candidatus Pacearchaeota archaeon]|nr:hypothetical protein [Candidatus Pacearchaeota archaeon]